MLFCEEPPCCLRHIGILWREVRLAGSVKIPMTSIYPQMMKSMYGEGTLWMGQ